jgi:hypothetical protein
MKTALAFLLLLVSLMAQAQDLYMTRNGKISFFSRTPMENIDATNNEVLSVIDLQKGDMAFAVLINGFRFEKALMEEHFNENYMESTKYPKATFNGKFIPPAELQSKKDGAYTVQVEGDLTIHGVTRKTKAAGELIFQGGKLSSRSSFKITIKDFNIAIPSVVAEKIADTIDVTVDCQYQPKNK